MLIHEIMKKTHLTKKAIEYYIEQGLICPAIQENGYRDFSSTQAERLTKISMLRRLGLSIDQIRDVLADSSNHTLQKLSIQKELFMQKEQQKKDLLEQLGSGRDYHEIIEELDAMDQNLSIIERLYDAFPGFYGRYICLHFAFFLTSHITTDEQKEAYHELTEFLDNIPTIQFSEDLKDYLNETNEQISTRQILSLTENLRKAVASPEAFLQEHKEILDFYCTYIQSEEYKASSAFWLKEQLHAFHTANGYYDIFLPAMKKLSPTYEKYCLQLEAANQIFLKQYPPNKK